MAPSTAIAPLSRHPEPKFCSTRPPTSAKSERRTESPGGRIVASIRPHKEERHLVGLTVNGDRFDYPGVTTAHTARLTTSKCLFNSVISTPGTKFLALDIKNFYYNTPMTRYKHMRLPLAILLDKIILLYALRNLACDGWVYVEIRKECLASSRPALLPINASVNTLPSMATPRPNAPLRSGRTPRGPLPLLLLLMTLASSTSLDSNTPTISSTPSKPCTTCPSIGPARSTAASRLPGIMTSAPF
jgi:hypothetical protein